MPVHMCECGCVCMYFHVQGKAIFVTIPKKKSFQMNIGFLYSALNLCSVPLFKGHLHSEKHVNFCLDPAI